jgi:CRP/FNR family transcriptional regulator
MANEDPLISFSQLPPQIESELRNALNVRSFSAGESIFLQGASANAVYLVASGRSKIVRVTPEGYENILCVRGPGDYFCPVPLLDNGKHLGTATAITDVTLFWVERDKFNALCEASPELLAIVQGDCLSEVRHLLHRLETFAFRNVRERLAITLLSETRRKGTAANPADELQLTQQEIAGLAGASRESVSRALKALEREDIVALKRGRVRICDRERLQKIADT